MIKILLNIALESEGIFNIIVGLKKKKLRHKKSKSTEIG
jgi:hypothetical protein